MVVLTPFAPTPQPALMAVSAPEYGREPEVWPITSDLMDTSNTAWIRNIANQAIERFRETYRDMSWVDASLGKLDLGAASTSTIYDLEPEEQEKPFVPYTEPEDVTPFLRSLVFVDTMLWLVGYLRNGFQSRLRHLVPFGAMVPAVANYGGVPQYGAYGRPAASPRRDPPKMPTTPRRWQW